ncbi:MAG: MgtC/SapB family protein, partial [Proteobacteria bacterium]|nr:MgtC/SapB family protein [Pseudomonadota bacterium]
MIIDADFEILRNFAIALFIGALIGVERERERERPQMFGGLRTFILIAEAGAASAWLSALIGSVWLFLAVGAGVCALVTASYVAAARQQENLPGITTEVAALVVFILGGACTYNHPEWAVVLAIVTSAVLTFKAELHQFAEKVGEDDMVAMLK